MSFDLTFRAQGGGPLTADALARFFSERPHYTLGGEARPFAAAYDNPDTGVAFTFESGDDGAVAFNLNYYRSHVFGLEAADELDAFAERFTPQVEDPQSGMTLWSRAAFLSAWNQGNRRACEIFVRHPEYEAKPPTFGYEALEAVWRWNLGRERLQEELGEDVFVPRVFFFRIDGEVRRLVVWTDGISVALPDADFVMLMRDDFARQWMRQAEPSPALVPFAEVLPLLEGAERRQDGPLPWRLYSPERVHEEVVRFFIEKPEVAKKGLSAVRFHELLDTELIESVKSPRN